MEIIALRNIVSGSAVQGKRVRFYSTTVDMANTLEREKRDGKAGRIAQSLMCMVGHYECADVLGYLPFSQAGGNYER